MAWGIAQVSQRAAPCKDRGVRILAVCAVAHPGGAEIGLLRLARRLLARGHVLTLATPAAGPLDDAGLPVVRLALGGLDRGAGARAAASFPRARRLAASHDLVYLNGTVSGRLLPGLAGRRTVLHVHDIVDRVPRFWSRADAVLADSGAVAERLPGLAAHVVYCPVELDVADVPPPWPPDDAGAARPVVGFVGRIEPRKGPLDLVRAAPAIRAARPDVRIVLVGDDPYDSAPEYAAQVRGAADVEHIPWVPDGAAVMRHLDVLVAPSRQEPFGTVLAEAMAAGTPVVATRVGGLAEVVADGVTGRLVEPGDPAELAAAVLAVLADRERMGAAARTHAQQFGADAYADRVEAILLGAARA
jgi:glycosyltransferase involved in cell wall biosynthesis